MIGRFLRTRGMRKLRRDRMALVALAIIAAYVSFASVAFVVVPLELTTQRIGPGFTPGFWGESTPEKRLEDAYSYLDSLESALGARKPQDALAALPIGVRKLVTLDEGELAERLDAAFVLYDELGEQDSLDLAMQGDEAAALEGRLVELEQEVSALFVVPGGANGLLHRLQWSLGTDRQGRSIFIRALYAIKVAVQIGAVSALVSVLIGTLLGGAAGFFGGWVDHLIVWLYSTFSAIPYIILLMVLAAMFLHSEYDGTLIPVYAAFCLTFWISPCRVVRGEVMKIKELEYVEAATSIGFSRMYVMLRHVVPNTVHLMFINFSLLFIGAIKAEVILSFLGLGVKNEPSWGMMINHARSEVLNGFFWQIGTATFFMVVLVLAFNVLSDALQDAFDPKHVG